MKGNFFSPSWYRVASLKSRLRGHVEIHRHYYRNEIWYVLQDHASGRFQRFTPSAYFLMGLMDGKRTIQEIWEEGYARLGDEAPTQDEMIRLLSQLHAVDVLQCDVSPDTCELLKRFEKQRFSTLKQNLICPLFMRFPLFDPERFLERFQPYVRPLFSWLGTILWLAVVGTGIFLAGVHWPALTENFTDRVLAAHNLVLLWFTFPILKAFHEFGHAFAVKVWGGEVHEMGIMMLVLTPVPFVDASAASAFREKRKRILVGAAGMIVELFIAAIALFIWINAETGPVRAITYNIVFLASVSSILFNGNPLLRFDAYYILGDILEISNLGQRGIQYTMYLVQRYLFGFREAEPPLAASGERFWFVVYTIASYAYQLIIYAGIVFFIANKFFIIGIILAVWGGIGMIVVPGSEIFRYLFSVPNFHRKRTRVITVCVLLAAFMVGVLCLLPVPLGTRAEGILWVPEQCFVRAGTEGFVERTVAMPGTLVKKGDPLIECSDPLLPAHIRVLESQLQELKALHDHQIVENRVQAGITGEEMGHVAAQLDRAREREGELVIRSCTDGIFIVPRAQDLPGRFVRRGELLGYVIDRSTITARVVVEQSDVDFVRQRTRGVAVRLAEEICDIVPAVLRREVPAATDQLPSRVLGQEGGGDIPIDPRDMQGVKAFQKVFLFDLELPDTACLLKVGSRVYVRFDHGWEPVIWRWSRAVRRLFIRRFNV